MERRRQFRTLFFVFFLIVVPLAGYGSDRADIKAEAIVKETNVERAKRNLGELKRNRSLDRIAYMRLKDMLENGYFGHASPGGADVTGLARSLNYPYSLIGENLAKGPFKMAGDIVSLWLNSPPHRKNLFTPEFTEIGVALSWERIDGFTIWHAVQVLGATNRSAPHHQ